MSIDLNAIGAARRDTLNVARNLMAVAIGACDANMIEYADTVVITAMRVLDTYEAVTQLAMPGSNVPRGDAPIPFRPRVRDDA